MTDAATVPAPIETAIVLPAGALESITRAEVDTQIATAHRFRRSVAAFKANALAMATLDQETAASCSYALPRRERQADGRMRQKTITGPSIRLAEICLATWGNLRAGTRVVADDGKAITAQAYAHDLEANTALTVEVRRGVLDRNGRRYSEDMVNLTANAASAIGLRNVIFQIIPRVFVEQIRQAAVKAAAGNERTHVERRDGAVAHFKSLGVSQERLLARLSEETDEPKRGIEDLTRADLELLFGFATSIKDGVATVEDLFPSPKAAAAPEGEGAAAKLAAELKLTTPQEEK